MKASFRVHKMYFDNDGVKMSERVCGLTYGMDREKGCAPGTIGVPEDIGETSLTCRGSIMREEKNLGRLFQILSTYCRGEGTTG